VLAMLKVCLCAALATGAFVVPIFAECSWKKIYVLYEAAMKALARREACENEGLNAVAHKTQTAVLRATSLRRSPRPVVQHIVDGVRYPKIDFAKGKPTPQ
jgi:hypothetical protein